MIDFNKKGVLDDTVAEYLVTLPYAVDSDGEGLWEVVPDGRAYGFEGADLAEFVQLGDASRHTGAGRGVHLPRAHQP